MKESDGSPSKFDGKDSTIIAELVAMDKGESWGLPLKEDRKTKLEYILKKLRYQKYIFQQYVGQMEAEIGRFWVTWPNDKVEFHSMTALKYFSKRGGPPEGSLEEIENEIKQEFSGLYSGNNLNAIIEAAQNPCGTIMNPSAREFIRSQAKEMLEIKAKISKLEKDLNELAIQTDLIPNQLLEVLGKTAASLIMVIVGDPRNYFCEEAFLKVLGLNLVESSSGKYQGQVHLSKRGNPEIRRLLYMSTLRLIQLPEIKPWYEAKKQGRRGKNGKECCTPALIAVMRKVMIGLYHAIKNNEPFDPVRLFRVKDKHPSQGLTTSPKQSSIKATSQQKEEVIQQKEEVIQPKEEVIQEPARRTKLNWPAVATRKSTKQAEKKEQEILLE